MFRFQGQYWYVVLRLLFWRLSMYMFLMPSMLAIVVIGIIQLRDQFAVAE